VQRTCDIDTAGPLPAGMARQAMAVQRSRAFCWSVRAGFITRGVTYGVIGGLAAALAVGVGSDGTSPNQQGALALIAQAPLGRVVIAVAAVGLLAYAVWKFGLGIMGRGPEGGGGKTFKDRIANLSTGVAYLLFFGVALEVLIGAAGRQAGEKGETIGVLGWPGGQFIVGIAGAVLVAVSLYQCYQAVCGQFIDDNKGHEMGRREHRVFVGLGGIGLVARAGVFALVGYFLCRTAVDFTTSGIGLDGTLSEVHSQPFGAWILAFVAIGLEIFALFSFFEARYQRL
jgi:Domain of Unknown Function (DUF1206)